MNKVTLPIETPRLILRKYLVDDVGDILEFSQAADFWLSRNLDWEVSEEGIRQYFEARLDIDLESYPDWFNLLIELKSESTVIGNIGIGIKDKEGKQAEIGWLLANHYQGMGIATEAAGAVISLGFDILGLHRIYARTGKTNTKSWRLMERLGMRQEAHFRKSHTVKGNWDDEFIYAILAEEWRKQSRNNTS